MSGRPKPKPKPSGDGGTKTNPAEETSAQIAFLEMQIRNLQEKLERTTLSVEQMTHERDALQQQLKQEREDKEDLAAHHRREIYEHELVREEQLRRNEELRHQLDELKEAYERSMAEQSQLLATKEMERKVEIEQLHEELNALLDFRREKEEILRKMEALEDTLEAERSEHRREVQEIERKVVVEKERLNAEMKQKLAEFKTSILKMTDDQLESTTKRTIEANERLLNELDFHAVQSTELAQQNDKLLAENRRLRTELSLLRQGEEEHARRHHAAVSMFRTVRRKHKETELQMRAETEAVRSEQDSRVAEVEQAKQQLQGQLELANRRIAELHQQLEDANQRVRGMTVELERQRALTGDVANFVAALAEDLTQALGRGRRPTESAAVEDAVSALERELQVAERERVLHFLLAKLSVFPRAQAGSPPAGDAAPAPAPAPAPAAPAAAPASLQLSLGADRTPSRDTLVSFTMSLPQPVRSRSPLAAAAAAAPLSSAALPKPFPSEGRLRPGEVVTHPVAGPVRDWGARPVPVALSLGAGVARKPNPLLAPIVK